MTWRRPPDAAVAAGLAFVTAALIAWQLVPGVTGVFHDDAVYVALGKALADGDGLRLINLPDEPLQRKYPIGHPALIALVWRVWPDFPANVVAMQAISVVATALFFGGAYLYLVRHRYASRTAAFVVTALSATAPLVLFLGGLVLSEFPFAVCVLVGLWQLESAIDAPAARRSRSFWTGVALGVPFLFRTIGLALPAAGVLLLAWRRRLRWPTLLGLLIPILPWVVWTVTVAGVGREGSGYYTDYTPPWETPIGFLADVAITNGFWLAFSVWQLPLYATSVAAFGATGVFWLGFVLLGVWTGLRWFGPLAAGRPLPWFLGCYLAITLVWPWPPSRFLVPVLPLLLVWIGATSTHAARWPFLTRAARAVGVGAALSATVVNVLAARQQAGLNAVTRYPQPAIAVGGAPPDWRSFEDLFAWIRTQTPPHATLGSGFDTMLFVYTGRPAIRPFPYVPGELFYGATTSRDPLLEFERLLSVNRVAYFVRTPMPHFAEERLIDRLIERAVHERPALLEVVYTGRDPRFLVFRVRQALSP